MFKLILAAVITSCVLERGVPAESSTNSMQRNAATDNAALSDRSKIRVVVCEDLIRELSKSTPKPVLFVALSDDEKRLVRLHVKDCDIRNPSRAKLVPNGPFIDKATGESGIALEIKSIAIEGKRARVRAGYFVTAGVTFDFVLAKETQWVIKKRNSRTVTE